MVLYMAVSFLKADLKWPYVDGRSNAPWLAKVNVTELGLGFHYSRDTIVQIIASPVTDCDNPIFQHSLVQRGQD
jgi:hypothetical protein